MALKSIFRYGLCINMNYFIKLNVHTVAICSPKLSWNFSNSYGKLFFLAFLAWILSLLFILLGKRKFSQQSCQCTFLSMLSLKWTETELPWKQSGCQYPGVLLRHCDSVIRGWLKAARSGNYPHASTSLPKALQPGLSVAIRRPTAGLPANFIAHT